MLSRPRMQWILVCISLSGAFAQESHFLVGGDVSALPKIEAQGGRFGSDRQGRDCLKLLSDQGANCYRVRLFVNPTGKGMVVQDLPYVISLAQRIKALGAQFLLDLHYSDTWADPAHQTKPKVWEDLDFATLQQTVRRYTTDVMIACKQAGVLPDLVQIGNEITPGFLWPDGKIHHPGDPRAHWEEFTQLLKAGIAGVHDALGAQDRVRIVIHTATGGQRAATKRFFDKMLAYEVPFDVIGLSYYPWWHGTLEDLRYNLEKTAQEYGKEILVVETAYPQHTGFSQGKGSWSQDRLAWPYTPEGQRAFFEALLRVVRHTPNGLGLGVVWWYPESIPVPGLKIWFSGAMALFDEQGALLPAAKEMGGAAVQGPPAGFQLVWADEFTPDGRPSPDNWSYEQGFVRNQELQWYQEDNAFCKDGLLVIEARREERTNPDYAAQTTNWKRQRGVIEYTSASLRTLGKQAWLYGRFEMRARLDTRAGLWPAFWTLGTARAWPHCGEIDIMEYYRGMILANAAWGNTKRWQPVWDSVKVPIDSFADPNWSSRFHIWRMDWDTEFIKLYVDDQLLNTIDLNETVNRDDEGANPFHEPHFIIVNLAVGGMQGGDPSETEFPARYEIDYVRVYQRDN